MSECIQELCWTTMVVILRVVSWFGFGDTAF